MSKFDLFITALLVIVIGVVNYSSCKYDSNDIKQLLKTVYAPPVVQLLKFSKATKVKNNGIGIPDEIKEKIMQPFFTTKPTGEGTGLGLSLTYDMVVKGHGGNNRRQK